VRSSALTATAIAPAFTDADGQGIARHIQLSNTNKPPAASQRQGPGSWNAPLSPPHSKPSTKLTVSRESLEDVNVFISKGSPPPKGYEDTTVNMSNDSNDSSTKSLTDRLLSTYREMDSATERESRDQDDDKVEGFSDLRSRASRSSSDFSLGLGMGERREGTGHDAPSSVHKLAKYSETYDENPLDGLDFSDVLAANPQDFIQMSPLTPMHPDCASFCAGKESNRMSPSPLHLPFSVGRDVLMNDLPTHTRKRSLSEPSVNLLLMHRAGLAVNATNVEKMIEKSKMKVTCNASNEMDDSESIHSGSVDELLGRLLSSQTSTTLHTQTTHLLLSRLKSSLDDNMVENLNRSFRMDKVDDEDLKQKDDEIVVRLKDMVRLMNKVTPDMTELDVETTCNLLIDMLDNYGISHVDDLVTYHGIMPVVEMFEARWSIAQVEESGPSSKPPSSGIVHILRFINKIIDSSIQARKQLCEIGVVPLILRILETDCKALINTVTASTDSPHKPWPFTLSSLPHSPTNGIPQKIKIDATILEASKCIHKIASTPQLTMILQATGGLPVLVQMVSFISLVAPSVGNVENVELGDGQGPAAQTTTINAPSTPLSLTIVESLALGSSEGWKQDKTQSTTSTNAPSPHHLFTGEEAQQLLAVVFMGVDCIIQLLVAQYSRTRNYCRTCLRLGLLPHLSKAFLIIISQLQSSGQAYSSSSSSDSLLDDRKSILDSVVSEPGETQSKEIKYALNIANIFDIFSRSDSVAAEQMVKEGGVLKNILFILRTLIVSAPASTDPPANQQPTYASPPNSSIMSIATAIGTTLTQQHKCEASSSFTTHQTLSDDYIKIIELLLKCLRNLSMEPSTLVDLENAGIIKVLLPLLKIRIANFKTYIVPTIFNLCRINKRRQEQAAMHGIIPHLQNIIFERSHMRQFALPVMFDMAHASAATRIELWKHDGIPFYINLLRENYWGLFALNSLAVWLANDTEHVQSLLIEPPNLTHLVNFFRSTSHQTIEVHKPLLDMMLKSEVLCRHLSSSGLFVSSLVRKIQQAEPIVLILLLKMVQLLHLNHINPRHLVLDNNFYSVVRSLAKSEEQVLVHQMVNRLLRDFQNSTLS